MLQSSRIMPNKNCFEITGKELKDFYDEYKEVLPESIKELENLFRKHD